MMKKAEPLYFLIQGTAKASRYNTLLSTIFYIRSQTV